MEKKKRRNQFNFQVIDKALITVYTQGITQKNTLEKGEEDDKKREKQTQAPHVPQRLSNSPLRLHVRAKRERERERETFGLLIVWDHDVTREVKPIQASA